MKRITSPDNPVLKQIRKLQVRKNREKEGAYLIEGFHLMQEALHGGETIIAVLFRESLLSENPTVNGLRGLLEEKQISVFTAPDDVFDRTADTETPQGVLGIVRRHDWTPDEFFGIGGKNTAGNVIVLDRLQDPGNVGTILRTADAAGFLGAVVLKGTTDVYSPKVIRAASGSVFRLPILFAETPQEAVTLLRKYGKKTAAATPYGDRDYFTCPLASDTAIIIGNEGAGISEALLEETDLRLKIPMQETVESLNAAIAAAVLMFESVRQQKYPIDGGK